MVKGSLQAIVLLQTVQELLKVTIVQLLMNPLALLRLVMLIRIIGLFGLLLVHQTENYHVLNNYLNQFVKKNNLILVIMEN